MSPTKPEMIMITGLPHQPERCTTHSGGGEKENERKTEQLLHHVYEPWKTDSFSETLQSSPLPIYFPNNNTDAKKKVQSTENFHAVARCKSAWSKTVYVLMSLFWKCGHYVCSLDTSDVVMQ